MQSQTIMGDTPNYPLSPPSFKPVLDHNNMNLSMMYYSFFVVATAIVILAIYHYLVINWCVRSSWPLNAEPLRVIVQSSGSQKVMQLDSTTFKYTNSQEDGGRVEECVVCLSAYEEGEDVRKLLRCNHSFHAPCIDMWLFSHFDCPLCRAPVGEAEGITAQPESSRVDLSDPSNSV